MSESHDNEQRDPRTDAESPETDVPGVDTDPDSKKKSIEVDTNQRLDEKDKHLDDIEEDQLEKERQERLDPENRPENTEVDNSDRTFDPKTGLFEDTDLEPPEDAPYSTTEAEESQTEDSGKSEEPEDREGSGDAEESGEATEPTEAKESKDTEAAEA